MADERWTEQELEAMLNRLPAVATEEFRRVFGPEGGGAYCIPQTFVGIEVLRYFGIAAKVWPCELRAVHGDLMVILGDGAAPETSRLTYSGHLVAVVPALESMLDLSLSQLRLKHAMPVPDASWFEWPATPPPSVGVEYTVGDVKLVYSAHPDPRAYRRHDFTQGRFVRLGRPMIGNLIRLLRGAAPRHQLGVRVELKTVKRLAPHLTPHLDRMTMNGGRDGERAVRRADGGVEAPRGGADREAAGDAAGARL